MSNELLHSDIVATRNAVTIKNIGFRSPDQQESTSYLDFLETWGRTPDHPW
jgi:hypothetical protein